MKVLGIAAELFEPGAKVRLADESDLRPLEWGSRPQELKAGVVYKVAAVDAYAGRPQGLYELVGLGARVDGRYLVAA